MLLHVFHFATALVFTWLAFSSLYIFLFSLLAHFYIDVPGGNSVNRKFAVLIKTDKNGNTSRDALTSMKNQSYPSGLFEAALISGSPDAENLNKALELLPATYDLVVVLDQNSSPEPDFLSKVNRSFYPHMKALQCHLTSIDSSLVTQRIICEEIHNHIFRKGMRASGFSASLAVSGMVFDYAYLKNLKNEKLDEELDLKLIAENNAIYYLADALVYDDHLQNKASLKQWFAVRLMYFKTKFGRDMVSAFRTGNTDLLNKSLQMAVLPVSMLLFALLVINFLLVASGFVTSFSAVNKFFSPGMNAWILLLVITGFSIMISVPRKFYNFRTLKLLVMNIKLRNI